MEGACVGGVFGGAHLDGTGFDVHSHLEFEVFDEGWVDLGPGGFERSHAMGWYGDFARLDAEDCGRGGRVGRREARAGFFVYLHCVVLRLCLGGRGERCERIEGGDFDIL